MLPSGSWFILTRKKELSQAIRAHPIYSESDNILIPSRAGKAEKPRCTCLEYSLGCDGRAFWHSHHANSTRNQKDCHRVPTHSVPARPRNRPQPINKKVRSLNLAIMPVLFLQEWKNTSLIETRKPLNN